MSALTKLAKRLAAAMQPKWEVRKTIWPYPDGYGVYQPATHTLLDAGLPREQAQAIVDQLNAGEEA